MTEFLSTPTTSTPAASEQTTSERTANEEPASAPAASAAPGARAARQPRRPAVARDVVVTAREQLTEHMLRLHLGGDDLTLAVHDSPGSWVKLFAPLGDGSEHGRAYTVRGFDPLRDEITIDVFLHAGGTMPHWASECRIGSGARIAGPRASGVADHRAEALALFADETALPAVAAILERESHSRHGRPVRAAIELGDARDRQELEAPAHAELVWLVRAPDEAPGTRLAAAAHLMDLLPGTAAWFAAEASAAKEARRALRAREVSALHAQGYWRAGVGDYRD